MGEVFRIEIDDGSIIQDSFSSKANKKFLDLFDWQRRGIEFFFC